MLTTSWSTTLLLLFITAAKMEEPGSSGSSSTQTCVHSNSTASVTNCSVLYNQSGISLVSPLSGYWVKVSSNKTMTSYRTNTLTLPISDNQLSFMNYNGLYKCDYDGKQIYYFNLTVYGPPEYVSNGSHHIYVPSSSEYAMVTTSDEHKFGTIVVQVVSNGGPFTVQWMVNNTDPCKLEHVLCPAGEKINETSTTFTLQIPTTYKYLMNGPYKSIVSNRYGNTTASTYMRYQCSSPGYDPVKVLPVEKSSTVTFQNGSLLSLPCVAKMSYINDYGMCYGIKNESFDSVKKKSGRCSACDKGRDCYVDLIGVTATAGRYDSTECNEYGIVLNVTYMEVEELTFYCYWADENEGDTFASYKVSLQYPPTRTPLRYLISIIFTSVLFIIAIIVIIVTISLYLVKRKRTRSIKIEHDVNQTTPIINVLEDTDDIPSITTLPPDDDEEVSTYGLYYGSFTSTNTNLIELPNDQNSREWPV